MQPHRAMPGRLVRSAAAEAFVACADQRLSMAIRNTIALQSAGEFNNVDDLSPETPQRPDWLCDDAIVRPYRWSREVAHRQPLAPRRTRSAASTLRALLILPLAARDEAIALLRPPPGYLALAGTALAGTAQCISNVGLWLADAESAGEPVRKPQQLVRRTVRRRGFRSTVPEPAKPAAAGNPLFATGQSPPVNRSLRA